MAKHHSGAQRVQTSGYVYADVPATTVTTTPPERAFDCLAKDLHSLLEQAAGLANDLIQIGDSLFGSVPRGTANNKLTDEVGPGRVAEVNGLIAAIRRNLDEIRSETQRLFTL